MALLYRKVSMLKHTFFFGGVFVFGCATFYTANNPLRRVVIILLFHNK